MQNAKTTEKRPKRVNKVQKTAYGYAYKKQPIVKVNLSVFYGQDKSNRNDTPKQHGKYS